MIDINEYAKKPRDERLAHIKQDEPCIERKRQTGRQLEVYRQGVMAHVFDTTLPEGWSPHVRVICENEECINPNHMYWGCCEWDEVPVEKK
jgi:hypothetical protein